MGPGSSDTSLAALLGMTGNTGDYVLGQQNFDQVVSRLMEQSGYVFAQVALQYYISLIIELIRRAGPPPANEQSITNLVKMTPADFEPPLDASAECAICKESFFAQQDPDDNTTDAKSIIQLPQCKHVFDADCIVHWLRMNGSCPVCRKPLKANDANKNESAMPSPDFRPD